jgi:predicted amidohydrolase/ribosomal protein S18 acetylase RimI-like enzyme
MRDLKNTPQQSTEDEDDSEYHLLLRNLRLEDYTDFQELSDLTYSKMNDSWTKEQFTRLLTTFPEGQICIEDKGKVVAVALSLIVDYSKYGDNHTYLQMVDNYNFKTHDYEGSVLYGIDVFVHPEYRGLRLGRRLYDARKELCENLNLKSIIAGGRIPGYIKYAKEMNPRMYLEKVKSKEIYDPILTFQLSNDFQVRKVLTNYHIADKASLSYASLLQWHNIYYEEKEQVIGKKKSIVRLGIIQWQMRTSFSIDSFLEQVEYFIDTVSSYAADFVLFPELFNLPLMEKYNKLSASDAIRQLAASTEEIREKMLEYAIAYNVNIVAGSMPVYDDGKLFNVSYLLRRDGTWDEQYKLHPTPAEVQDYGMQGGHELQVFDTDVGKVGILICYDVEFPELPRLLAQKGVKILFVPFLTDTSNAFHRVKLCAQARAIENECYVAIGGSVGNLPRVSNMGLQYAQSAVFSPSDFAFPKDGVVSEATANTEMSIIADVDLDLLMELHEQGSVQNIKDRRKDLYSLKWVGRL